MVTIKDKAQRIYMEYVRCFDPMFGILIKKTIHQRAIKAAILHCIQTVDELQVVIDNEPENCNYAIKRRDLFEDVKKHLETMI